ncbi:hypothetical protein FOH24_16260 [Acetobacter tropicalis]|nr:hypothetical protein [Acetobacter tropicalis]KAA8385421.1 hypothetical protein FOH24_16260 [Acetobacter tropicalis]KAA8386298.1 hypothetical protein FOH22_11515 [Acetobacter tropicalis]MBC9010192.1 hypothetical protein [Acetobacter tropicalis]
MSQKNVFEQIERFLSTENPEVLSVSGRWGVGKTHLWNETLKANRATAKLRNYAYVSLFGMRSLDALTTAIVQSTVSLEGPELEPTFDSYLEHLSSFPGVIALTKRAARKSTTVASKAASTLPYVGKLADLFAPGAALLISKQIICIDDIERAGQGLDMADVLGMVSSLCEHKGCKVVLLLNEDALGEQGTKYRSYIEKVVDQAVRFEPTPEESAVAAISAEDVLGQQLAKQTVALGIKNIRVIRRIRRFLQHLESELTDLHSGVTERVIKSIALLGWCVFEPTLAPDLALVCRYAKFRINLSNENCSANELNLDQLLKAYDFGDFDQIDQVLSDGLQAGAFDRQALQKLLEDESKKLASEEAREVISKPWKIFHDGLGNDQDKFIEAICTAFERYSNAMSPTDASDALQFLRELGRTEEAERFLPMYVDTQKDKPREFFALYTCNRGRLDPHIVTAFDAILAGMPVDRDPTEILRKIVFSQDWGPDELAYLATLPSECYDKMLKDWQGHDLNNAIYLALDFGRLDTSATNKIEFARQMAASLQRIAAESGLNRLRLRPYLTKIPPALMAEEQSSEEPDN